MKGLYRALLALSLSLSGAFGGQLPQLGWERSKAERLAGPGRKQDDKGQQVVYVTGDVLSCATFIHDRIAAIEYTPGSFDTTREITMGDIRVVWGARQPLLLSESTRTELLERNAYGKSWLSPAKTKIEDVYHPTDLGHSYSFRIFETYTTRLRSDGRVIAYMGTGAVFMYYRRLERGLRDLVRERFEDRGPFDVEKLDD